MTDLTLQMRRSPNFGQRRNCVKPDMVVLHYTAMNSAEEAIERLCDPEFEVSAHYLIASDGQITQMVDEDKRAWHAGAGQWGDVKDVNSHSIGIELANTGQTPFAAQQMDALEQLLAGVLKRHNIEPKRVIGHSDMAPARKIDPGARFDWARLARQGMSVAPKAAAPSAPSLERFKGWLVAFGYPADAAFEPLLSAFRDRFRPRYDGPLDDADMALAQDLAVRFTAPRLFLDQPAPTP